MDGTVKIVIGMVVVLAIGLPIAGKVLQANSAQGATEAKPAAAPVAAAPPATYYPQQPQPVQPRPAAPAPRPQGRGNRGGGGRGGGGGAAPLWNAQNLVNTAWAMQTSQAGVVTVSLFPGGVFTATSSFPIPIQGNWSVNGARLNVSITSPVSQTLSAQIVGDQIMVDGRPARRVR